MKRFLLIVLFLLVGFYVAWPALSLWQIHSAVKSGDAEKLKQKIDFGMVRASLRPAVEGKIAKKVEELKAGAGSGSALLGAALKGDVLERVAKVVLERLVTAENFVRISNETGTLSEKIERLVVDEISKMGGGFAALQGGGGSGRGGDLLKKGARVAASLGIKVPDLGGGSGQSPFRTVPNSPVKTVPAASAESPANSSSAASGDKQPMGLSNIKRFGFTDPLAFEVGVAKNPAATAADVTARMSFTGFDWKLTGVTAELK